MGRQWTTLFDGNRSEIMEAKIGCSRKTAEMEVLLNLTVTIAVKTFKNLGEFE